jgi:hypothetical protein
VAVAVAAALAAPGCGDGGAPAPARPTAAEDHDRAPLRTCRTRNEGRGPVAGPDGTDVRLGPAYFDGAAQLAAEDGSRFTPRAGRAYMEVKVLLALRARTRATLVAPPPERRAFGLLYAKPPPPSAGPFTVRDGGAAVRLHACAETAPAFGYRGTVGPWTQFGGGFLLAGPGCHAVELHVAGRRTPYRATLSFGAGAC